MRLLPHKKMYQSCLLLVSKMRVRFGKMLWFLLQVVCYNGHAKQYRIDLVQFWVKTASEKMEKYRKKYSFPLVMDR